MRTSMSTEPAAYALLLCLFCHVGVSLGDQAWQLVSDSEGVRIYQRATSDAFPEIRADLVFDAPPERVHEVITDYDHFEEFVPDVAKSRVVRCAGNVRWVHQRLEFPGPVAPREYVLQITDRLRPTQSVYSRIDWTSVAPAEYGVHGRDAVAPRRFTGFWVLHPVRGGGATAADYGVHFDAGGGLPGWLITPMTHRYALSVIAAVRKRIRMVAIGSASAATGGASAPGADPSTGGVKPLVSLAASTSADTLAEPGCGTSRPVPGAFSGGSREATQGAEVSALGDE
jgi:uncharacterized protein YndB with AHSA1/START domain